MKKALDKQANNKMLNNIDTRQRKKALESINKFSINFIIKKLINTVNIARLILSKQAEWKG